jgi:hypothetical protein
MPVKIKEKIYYLPGEEGQRSLTLAEQRRIEREFRRPLEKILASASVTDKQLKSMPESKRDEIEVDRREIGLIMIWVSRLRAGEDLTFDEATDIEIENLEDIDLGGVSTDDPKAIEG